MKTQLGSLLSVKSGVYSMVPHNATIYEAAEELFLKSADVILILGRGEKLQGFVSGQDIVRCIYEMGEDIFSKRIDKVMHIDIMTCMETESLDEGMEALSKLQMRYLPVMSNDGELRGFIHSEDIVKAKLSEVVQQWRENRKENQKPA